MKRFRLYEVKLIDGSRYQGEIAYKDEKMLVLRPKSSEHKLRLFYNGIISIRELGWQKALVRE